MVKEALLDPKDSQEYGEKLALKDHRGTKELLESLGRGVRKVTEDSPGSKACKEQKVPQEMQEL